MSFITQTITTQFPTYLTELLRGENGVIELVYNEVKREHSPEIKTETLAVCAETSSLDLTGNPLEVDLIADNETIVETPVIVQDKIYNWTKEEAQYYPLREAEARAIIQNALLDRKPKIRDLYVLCNDPKEKKVLISTSIGKKDWTRSEIYVLDCCPKSTIMMDLMKTDHLERVNRFDEKAKLSITETKTYTLFGFDLKKSNDLTSVTNNGFLSLEVTKDQVTSWNNANYSQIILGHDRSKLNNFWMDLSAISFYLSLLESSLTEDTFLTSSGLECDEVVEKISEALNEVRPRQNQFQARNQDFDLENLRALDVFDDLWNILKRCKNVGDLKTCFDYLCAMLRERDFHFKMVEENCVFHTIFKNIQSGTMITPNLGTSHCLELLIELGLGKLIRDYSVILHQFFSGAKQLISDKWSNLTPSAAMARAKNLRRTFSGPLTDKKNSTRKLVFLKTLHKTSEFIYLFKNNLLPKYEKGFNEYCQKLRDTFLQNSKHTEIEECVCEFSTEVTPSHFVDVDSEPFTVFYVKFESITKWSAEIVTAFHFSEFPIFPPSVFDYSCLPIPKDEPFFYVTKLCKFFN